LSIDIAYSVVVDGKEHPRLISNELIVPGLFLVYFCQAYAFVKGSLTTSWFTDNILPILYALVAIVLYANTWWQKSNIDHAVFKNAFNQLLISI
jgi:hypothetical protein